MNPEQFEDDLIGALQSYSNFEEFFQKASHVLKNMNSATEARDAFLKRRPKYEIPVFTSFKYTLMIDPEMSYQSRIYNLQQIKKNAQDYKSMMFQNIDDAIYFLRSRLLYLQRGKALSGF